jgi:hypothetical protein
MHRGFPGLNTPQHIQACLQHLSSPQHPSSCSTLLPSVSCSECRYTPAGSTKAHHPITMYSRSVFLVAMLVLPIFAAPVPATHVSSPSSNASFADSALGNPEERCEYRTPRYPFPTGLVPKYHREGSHHRSHTVRDTSRRRTQAGGRGCHGRTRREGHKPPQGKRQERHHPNQGQ